MLDSERSEPIEPFNPTDTEDFPEVEALVSPQIKEPAERPAADLNADSLFSAELATTTLLTRPEEEELARKISKARRRVRAILRRARRITTAALTDGGRGVIVPEEDFREREAVTILNYARLAIGNVRQERMLRMTRKDLRGFVADLSTALDEYREHRDKMVRANVRLVNVLARRYHHPTLTTLDLFQEGTLGLLRAIEKFDPERAIKFSTYATWWIWQQLGRAADTHGSLIRTPVHWGQFRRRLSRDEQGLAADNDGKVTRQQLAESQGIDQERFDAMSQSFFFVSTDAPVSEDDDRTLETILASDSEAPEDHASGAALRKQLEEAMQHLPERESYILRQRFGWQDDNTETLEDLGTRLGVSRERIRQLESRALNKLRDICRQQGLHEYLH